MHPRQAIIRLLQTSAAIAFAAGAVLWITHGKSAAIDLVVRYGELLLMFAVLAVITVLGARSLTIWGSMTSQRYEGLDEESLAVLDEVEQEDRRQVNTENPPSAENHAF